MGKLANLFGEPHVPKNLVTSQGIISKVNVKVNGLGWLTIDFFFENSKSPWSIMRMNEDPYQEILLWFLQKGAEFGGFEEEISINKNTASFDGGKTWIPTYNLCDDVKTLQHFVGKSMIVKTEYLQDGAVSFDNGKTWFDIDARKKELDDKWYANGGRIGIKLL